MSAQDNAFWPARTGVFDTMPIKTAKRNWPLPSRCLEWLRALRFRIARLFLRSFQERYILKQMVDTSPDVIFYKSREGKYLGINDAYRTVWQTGWDSVYGKTDFDLHDAEVAEQHEVSDAVVYNTGETVRVSGEADVVGGGTMYFDVIKSPIRDRSDKVVGLVGVARDVSEMRLVQNKLKQHNEFLEAFSEIVLSLPAVGDGVARFDRVLHSVNNLLDADEGHVLDWDPARQQWVVSCSTGVQADMVDIVAKRRYPDEDLFVEKHHETSYIGAVLNIENDLRHCLLFQKADCAHFDQQDNLIALRQISRQFQIVFLQMSLLRQVHLQAEYDQLTKLFNRWSFERRLRDKMAECKEADSGFLLLYIDLDGFKPVNDNHGHAVGDDVLKQVAVRIKSCMCDNAFCARLGGDEFAIICDSISGSQTPRQIATSIDQDISRPIEVGEAVFTIGASVGIAIYPEHGDTDEALLHVADHSMYVVKDARKKNAAQHAA